MHPEFIEIFDERNRHNILETTWGRILNIDDRNKILEIKKGRKTAIQFHAKANKTFIVIKGKILFIWVNTKTGDEESNIICPGMAVCVNALQPYRLCGFYSETSMVIECASMKGPIDTYKIHPEG